MVKGVIAKGMTFSHPLPPERSPTLIKRIVAFRGFFIGEKKGRLDLMFPEDRSDEFGRAHVACIEREVDRFAAGSSRWH